MRTKTTVRGITVDIYDTPRKRNKRYFARYNGRCAGECIGIEDGDPSFQTPDEAMEHAENIVQRAYE